MDERRREKSTNLKREASDHRPWASPRAHLYKEARTVRAQGNRAQRGGFSQSALLWIREWITIITLKSMVSSGGTRNTMVLESQVAVPE